MEIHDALFSTGNALGRYNCDSNSPAVPPVVYSTGRYMWVKFYSSDESYLRSDDDIGFKARFEAVDIPGKYTVIRDENTVNSPLTDTLVSRQRYLRAPF